MLSKEDDQQQSEDIDRLINTAATAVLEVVVREAARIKTALEAGHPEDALTLVEGLLKGSRAALDEFKC